MWTYFKFECRSFFTNRKNLAVYLLLLFLSLFYWLQIESNFQSLERVQPKELKASVETKSEFLRTVNREGDVHPLTQSAIDTFPAIVENEENQIQALKDKDYHTFATFRSEWMLIAPANPLYAKDNNIYFQEEMLFDRNAKYTELVALGKSKDPVTLDSINDKTAIKALIRSMDSVLPLVLILSAIIFSMDIVAKDRKHTSLMKGLPLSEAKRMFIKALVIVLGMFLAILPLTIGFLGIGLSQSFGSLSEPIASSFYLGNKPLLSELSYRIIPASQYLMNFTLLISLFIICFILISLLLSYWIKNAYFLMVVLLGLPFIELFYNRFGYGDIHRITYLPFSYVRVGEVVSGHRGFFFADPTLTYQMGLIVVLISSGILFALLAIVTRFKRSV